MRDHLDKLESKSVHILREAYAAFGNLCMLWSIGKDSTVLLWLARKAFYGHVPFPLVHIDTHYKIPEMIEYRDRLAMEYGLYMVYGENREALENHETFPDGKCSRVECCRRLKTEALTHTLDGTWPRYRLNLQTGKYERDTNTDAYTGVIVGARADEEGSRSKERYFSPRDKHNDWDLDDQPPEFWNQFKTDFAPGTHVRIHPLLDWTELNVWEYIEREHIPTVSLYYNQGDGTRYRYYMQMMRDDPDTERGRDYLAGVEELGVTCLGCFWHRAFFRWEDDGRPVEMFSDLASQALEAKCVRSAQLAAAVWCAVNAALLFFRAWLDLDAARGFDELYADLIAAGASSVAEAWAPRIAMYAAFGLLWLGLTVWGVRAAVRTHRKWRGLKDEQLVHE